MCVEIYVGKEARLPPGVRTVIKLRTCQSIGPTMSTAMQNDFANMIKDKDAVVSRRCCPCKNISSGKTVRSSVFISEPGGAGSCALTPELELKI